MRTDDFDFVLPESLIAQVPSARRDGSRLLVLARESDLSPKHCQFSEIKGFLREGDLLIMNNTRVFPARIQSTKETGGRVELLFVEKVTSNGVGVLQDGVDLLQQGDELPGKEPTEQWLVMAKASRPLRPGQELALEGGETVKVLERVDGGQYRLQLSESLTRMGLFVYLSGHGSMPLPPYIAPDAGEIEHKERYQTVYAEQTGAIAAPTAGLHFTQPLLDEIVQTGVELAYLTLHVGLGTFLPVRAEEIADHDMHSETYTIPEETIEKWKQTRARGGRVIAVGTTSLRALEAASQESGEPQPGMNSTSIFIYPGYTFRAIDGLLTNFHLPRSTLFMLVSAFHGRERMIAAYEEAIANGYRFYSYGDAMLIA